MNGFKSWLNEINSSLYDGFKIKKEGKYLTKINDVFMGCKEDFFYFKVKFVNNHNEYYDYWIEWKPDKVKRMLKLVQGLEINADMPFDVSDPYSAESAENIYRYICENMLEKLCVITIKKYDADDGKSYVYLDKVENYEGKENIKSNLKYDTEYNSNSDGVPF
ncbi:MAG: hypothetical protein FWG98_06805 [Candidatus Cloacimonetes bacterium]|nr:hypothetical protein [Candidatus Cloacimonadota bacterium]